MKVLGLITEYNPFHNGHKYHIEHAIKQTNSDYVISVMSGNFVQRGEPSLLNKWAKTEMALNNGVDLVIELPVVYAIQSAEYFAFAGVKILDSLNIVDSLCFGSELGDIKPLRRLAQILANEPPILSESIKYFLNKGISYPKARELALTIYISIQDKDSNLLTYISKDLFSPNNILGIEYLKALYKLNSKIKPVTIQRYKSNYHSLDFNDNIASASAIRNIINTEDNINFLKNLMPKNCFDIILREINNERAPMCIDLFDLSILTLLRKLSPLDLTNFPDMEKGLENRICTMANKYSSLKDLVSSIKTKRYTHTRIQRILFNILMGITNECMGTFQKLGGPQYIRILGMNDKGKKLLKVINQRTDLPLIVKPAAYKNIDNDILHRMIRFDFLATDLYSLHFPGKDKRMGKLDYYTSPIII